MWLTEAASNILRYSARMVIPATCLVCDEPLPQGYLCYRCRPSEPHLSIDGRCLRCFSPTNCETLCQLCKTYPPPQGKIRYMWSYDEKVKFYIHAMKYRPSLKLTVMAGRMLADFINTLDEEFSWDCAVSTPATPKNLKRRGFNQTDILAYLLTKKLCGLKLCPDVLRRSGTRSPQALLKPEERIRGMRGTFTVSSRAISGRRVLLIDDVLTTGATSNEATRMLFEAGAVSVDLVALARTSIWQRYRVGMALRY